MDDENVRHYIAITANYLDDDHPGWPQTLVNEYGIDLGYMDVSDPDRCILSAIYGEWDTCLVAANNADRVEDAICEATSCSVDDDDLYRELWLYQVDSRLGNV